MKTENSSVQGDIKKLKITIDGEDISPNVLLVEIHQSIFTPSWDAVLLFDEASNSLMNLPIMQGGKVEIEVETAANSKFDGEHKYKFIVYGISDRLMINQNHLQYKVSCITEGFLKNFTKRVQKSFSDKKAEEIVQDIISNYVGGGVEVDSSDNNYHIIIPNWSPFLAVWWCAKVAIKDNASDFIFYMKDDNKYAFKSLEKLYKKGGSELKFTQTPFGIRNDAGDTDTDYSLMFTKYHFDHYDGLANLGAGYYKSKLFMYDIMNRNVSTVTLGYGDDVPADAAKKSWKGIFDKSEDASISFFPQHTGLHEKSTPNDFVSTWYLSRRNNLLKLNQNKLTIQLPGGAKSYNWIGKMADVKLPSHQDLNDEKYDKYFKGKYLITDVKHFISHGNYTLNIGFIRKRLEKQMQ